MSSYLVLARKYRPKQFSDIVGQLSVVKTLVNAIQLNRTHQAYIFSGSRGIGKTSIARIFSKALRCPNVVLKDELLVSCDQCADCIEIAAGNSVNVLEIDGASNNGVDSIREIRENVKFLPATGKHKIYIIDEVHMLTTQAFNALLKTLEEPPEHVVFIFATTESHKIPETILGRCQRFDFKRVTIVQITERLKDVLSQEKIAYEDAALNLIARAAEGSMRDALSILDQVISFSSMKVTALAVRESIGLIGTEMVYALLNKILSRNTVESLVTVQTAFNQGVDLKVLLKSLQEMLHAVLLFQVGVEKPETHFNDDELLQISGLKTLRPLEENEMIFQVFHHGLDLLSKASQPKLIFDLLMIKTAAAESLTWAETDSNPRRLDRRSEPDQVARHAEQITVQPSVQPVAQPIAPAKTPIIKTGEGFTSLVFASKPMLGVMLEAVVEWVLPIADQPRLGMGFRERDQGKMDQIMQKVFRDQIIQLSETYFGFKVVPDAFISQFAGESSAEKAERTKIESKNQKLESIQSLPVIQEAKALFGAELVQIEVIEKDGT